MDLSVDKLTGFKSVVSAKGAAYTVSGTVSVENDNLQGIESGAINDDKGNQVGSFTYFGNLSINFSESDATKLTDILKDAQSYIDAVKANAKNLGVLTKPAAKTEAPAAQPAQATSVNQPAK